MDQEGETQQQCHLNSWIISYLTPHPPSFQTVRAEMFALLSNPAGVEFLSLTTLRVLVEEASQRRWHLNQALEELLGRPSVARLCQAKGAGGKDVTLTYRREWQVVTSGQSLKGLVPCSGAQTQDSAIQAPFSLPTGSPPRARGYSKR